MKKPEKNITTVKNAIDQHKLVALNFMNEKEIIRNHYKRIGSKGGLAGTGKAKARTKTQARMAAKKKWDNYKANKSAARGRVLEKGVEVAK